MYYAFEPIPLCTDPATLQEHYFLHNMTTEDCWSERRKFISGRIYFAATIFNAFFILLTTLLFIYCASTKKSKKLSSQDDVNSKNRLRLIWKRYSLQKKSVACTTLGAFGHLLFSSSFFAAQAFNPTIACYLVLYGSVVGFYTWMFAYCTRAYRLRYLYELNQFKFKYSRMSDEEKLLCLKDKKYRWYTVHNQRKPKNVLRTPFLIYGVSIIIILAVTIPSQQHAILVLHRCDTTWGAYALMGMFGFFIVVLMPVISYSLKNNSDAHGIKTELWMISFIGLPLFLLYAVFFFKLSPAQTNPRLYIHRVFAPANWVVFFTALAHLVSVVIPLLGYLPLQTYKFKKIFSRYRKGSVSENFDIGGGAPRPISSLSLPLEHTIECLERSLADPYLMNQLQEHAIRDFSSENLLFYEKFLSLEEKLRNEYNISDRHYPPSSSDSPEAYHLSQPVPDHLLPECVELYESFVRESAAFQVNISYKARAALDKAFLNLYKKYPHLAAHAKRTSIQPDRSYNATIPLWDNPNHSMPNQELSSIIKVDTSDHTLITLGLFEIARTEVCWNIFNSVYLKLIEQD
ncbi:hypothetical protein BY458DRAFT_528589 [Sporodiniella umbellata]|nr:hypothetical protein BY458DRAFT_528589 [Sporodiniella umbellata]